MSHQVADNVWMAVGYALANSILIKGEDGLIIVDTLDSNVPAEEVAPLFMQYGDNLPVTGIIYTHNHPDHISGAHVSGKSHRLAGC